MARSTTSTRRRPTELGTAEQLPSGRWRAVYRSGGHRHRAPHTFTTRAEAVAWLAAERAAQPMRRPDAVPSPPRPTLAEYATSWLDSRSNLAERTRDGYAQSLHTWILPGLNDRVELGRLELARITPATVREWFTTMGELAGQRAQRHQQQSTNRGEHPARQWGRDNGWPVAKTGRLSPQLVKAWTHATANQPRTAGTSAARPGAVAACNAYRVLRAICNAAVRDGLLAASPCTVEGAGSVRHPERTPATPAEVELIAEAMPAELRAAVRVAAWSGLRFGELFALARRHVDIDAGSVRVERAVNRARRFGPPKTASSLRTVFLPRFVVHQLAEHMAHHTGPDPDSLLFTARTGAPVRQDHAKKHFRRAANAIGRHDLRWHDLRHTGATLAYQAGGNMRDVQRRLGHSTARAAMIYAHAADHGDQLLAARLDAAFSPTPVPPLPDPSSPHHRTPLVLMPSLEAAS